MINMLELALSLNNENLFKYIKQELELSNFTQNMTIVNDSPVGSILAYTGITPPKHYLTCDGMEYNITEYPFLSMHIKEQFQSYNYFGGDDVHTFCVPDLRGEFLKGTGINILYCIKYEPTYYIKEITPSEQQELELLREQNKLLKEQNELLKQQIENAVL